MNSKERLHLLLSIYMDGTLDADEEREMLSLLQSPECAAEFLEFTSLDMEIRQCAGTPVSTAQLAQAVQADIRRILQPVNIMDAVRARAETYRLNRRFRLAAMMAVFSSAAACVLLAFLLGIRTPETQPRVSLAEVETAEDATVSLENNDRAARSGMDLFGGETLRVGQDGKISLRYPDQTRLRLSQAATLLMQNGAGTQLSLTAGMLGADVSAQTSGAPMIITTPHAQIKIVGTSFRIFVDQKTRLEVGEGSVLMTRVSDGSEVTVSGGQFAVTGENGGLKAEPLAPILITVEAESASLKPPMNISRQRNLGYIVSSDIGFGSASMRFDLPYAGEVVVWARIWARSAHHDSFVVWVDDGTEDVFDTSENAAFKKWRWVQVNGRRGGQPLAIDPRKFNLAGGSHQLYFRSREPTCRLDKVLITNDLKFIPADDPEVVPEVEVPEEDGEKGAGADIF